MTYSSAFPAEQGDVSGADLLMQFTDVREMSETICKPLAIEDYGIQTFPDVSPPKWHLAHTSWFFETFILKDFYAGYQEFHPQYAQQVHL